MLFFIAACNGSEKKFTTESSPELNAVNGEILFNVNCANCHKPDKDFTAPALKGALQRWGGDKKAMYEFIRNPTKSIVENAYAKQLFEKWNRTMMMPSTLSDAELDDIMKYCEK